MNFASQIFFNKINHGYRADILKKKSFWLLPFYMAVATYFYYEMVHRTIRSATVSYLLNSSKYSTLFINLDKSNIKYLILNLYLCFCYFILYLFVQKNLTVLENVKSTSQGLLLDCNIKQVSWH